MIFLNHFFRCIRLRDLLSSTQVSCAQIYEIGTALVPDYIENTNSGEFRGLFVLLYVLILIVLISVGFVILLRQRVFVKTKELVLREVLLHRSMELGSIVTWEMDPQKKRFYFSHEFFELIGFDYKPMCSYDFFEKITHPEDYDFVIEKIQSAVTNNENFDIKFRLTHKSGEMLYVHLIGLILIDKKQNVRITGILQNVSEQKRHEIELIKAKEKAEESEQLKSAFLANMSHEIRTPLNAIVGFSDILTSKKLPPEKILEFNKIIKQHNTLMLKLMNDIIDFAKIESGTISIKFEDHVNVNEVIREVYVLMKKQCPHEIEFRLGKLSSDAIAKIPMDSIRLKQALHNIILNAFKFTSKGWVYIGSRFIKEKNELEIYVEDSGKGISAKDKERIFERFYQVDAMTQGTGLGLSISKSLTHLLGGKLSVVSEIGNGSEFILTFPRKNVNSEQSKQTMEYQEFENFDLESVDLKGKETLVVEDLMSNYLLLETVLESMGVTITWAQNGAEAIEIVKDKSFDIILMDLKMPVMDGFTATRKLKQMNIETPVIAVTAYVFDSDREKAIDAGCVDYISKPIDKDELIETMARALKLV